MGDLLGNAVSGLLSFQRALATTSHNIANVNTEGYSRQRVELDTRFPSVLGTSFVGSGVEITTIQRYYDQFITNSVRSSNSSYFRLEKFTDMSAQIDNLLADPRGGISPILQEFFSSMQDVSDDPSSGTARFQLLSSAEALVNRFSSFDVRLDQLAKNTEVDIQAAIEEINQLAASIADINRTLEEVNTSNQLTQQSSDLLDTRDSLISDLSKLINVQVVNEPRNNITVLVGNGQTMVSGADSFGLSVQPDPANPSENIIVYNGFSQVSDISSQLNGGELGGLLDFRSTVLRPAINAIGRMAIGLADSFNDQHRMGMDLQDTLGGDFFGFDQPQTIPRTSNAGTSTITTTITDISQLTIDDYTLNFTAGNWQLVSSSGSSSALVADASPADTTLVFEGLTVVIDGASAPVSGDQFSIEPTSEGAGSLSVLLTNSNQIAAAAPIRTESSLDNLGDIVISQGIITDASNPAALDPTTFAQVTFSFDTPATTFTASEDVIVGGVTYAAGASIPYSNNMVIDSDPNIWQVSLSGINPQPGDTLIIEGNLGGTGDNRNALNLANLQTMGIFDNGVNNYQEAYGSFVGRVGSMTHSAEIERDAQDALLTQAIERRSEVAGVNLDEEAADMIKYQQAYQAAAQVIATAQTLFDTLINSTR